jgi:preprotein translocase subunit SecG
VTVIYYIVIAIFLFVCLLLCGVVMMQESKSSGLGASFGGDSGDSLFGTATADVLKRITGWLALAFMAGCVILSLWTSAMNVASSGPLPTVIEEDEA